MTSQPYPNGLVFSQTSPFYVPVASFLAAVCGSPAVFLPGNKMGYTADDQVGLSGVHQDEMDISPLHIYEKIQGGYITSDIFMNSLCAMLSNHAFELVKDKNGQTPEFEFFRHIRNASSHQNRFHFYRNEPARPASWRGVIIDDTKKAQSNPLAGTQCFGYFLGISDLLLLLKDIDVSFNSSNSSQANGGT